MNLTIDTIAAIVTRETGVTPEEMRGRTRHVTIIRARWMLVGLIRDYTHYSFPDIAEWFGPGCNYVNPGAVRSHSSAIYQWNGHDRLRPKDRRYRDEYLRIARLVREQRKQPACKLERTK